MNKPFKIAAMGALAVIALSKPAFAGVGFVFVMPQSVDPEKLTFIQNGAIHIRDDDGGLLTGNTFLPAVQSGGDGLEVHGQIPVPQGPTNDFMHIDKIVVHTTFLGELDVTSSVESGFSGFDPWQFEKGFDSGPGTLEAEQFIIFTRGSNGAPLFDDPTQLTGFFGLFSATNPDGNMEFPISRFSVQAFATPEPGSIAMVGSLLCVGGLAAIRQMRRRRA